jgi:hypothetical protein
MPLIREDYASMVGVRYASGDPFLLGAAARWRVGKARRPRATAQMRARTCVHQTGDRQEIAMTLLRERESFYVIVGPSAAALTGLTFVAITLAAQVGLRGYGQGIAAYNTPTIVHFGVVLFVCALLSAPWPDLTPPALLLGLCGLAGVIYTLIVTRRLRRFSNYAPVLEDWLTNAAGPLLAYLALVVGAALLPGYAQAALFVTGAALALLMFLGIHNAWDVVTYTVVERVLRRDKRDSKED